VRYEHDELELELATLDLFSDLGWDTVRDTKERAIWHIIVIWICGSCVLEMLLECCVDKIRRIWNPDVETRPIKCHEASEPRAAYRQPFD